MINPWNNMFKDHDWRTELYTCSKSKQKFNVQYKLQRQYEKPKQETVDSEKNELRYNHNCVPALNMPPSYKQMAINRKKKKD